MKVLFVCSGNAYRSPLAEALLKKMRPDLQVDSAGTHAESRISVEARRYAASQNVGMYLKRTPESLETKRLVDYDLIIAMEQVHQSVVLAKCPECRDRIIVWNIEDLGFMPYEYDEEISRQIEGKTSELAKSL